MKETKSPSTSILTGESIAPFWKSFADNLPLHIMSLNQENTAEPHSHDFIELVFVHRGKGLHLHGSNKYPIFAGDCFVIVPGEHHGYEDGRNLRITNMLFYPEILGSFEADLQKIPGFIRFFSIEPLFRQETSFKHKLHLNPSQQNLLISLRDQIEREMKEQTPGYLPLCKSLFIQLLVFVSRSFDTSITSQNVRNEFDGKEKMVAAAISFLEQNYSSDVSVEDIAKSAFVSSSRLSHVFTSATGMSLIDYLTKLRINRACELVASTGKTVSEIAYLLGFHDPSYFGRAFKQNTGKTPSEYRKSIPRN
jgi:AraC-like DNA-binding protein